MLLSQGRASVASMVPDGPVEPQGHHWETKDQMILITLTDREPLTGSCSRSA